MDKLLFEGSTEESTGPKYGMQAGVWSESSVCVWSLCFYWRPNSPGSENSV